MTRAATMETRRERARKQLRQPVEVHGRHATFVIEQAFSCSPEQLWPWLTEPALIARWSRAPVHMSGPFAEGAERTVQIHLGPLRVIDLNERVTRVQRERRFEYTGSTVQSHRGQAVLEPVGAHTKLSWTAEFEAPLSGLARPMAGYVRWQMEHSLAKLAALLA
ncbi:MAG: Polyketide cyclase/dehydrase [Myxococcaceae bacterium]|nr:Polyketide cyclase/dehydrase [Myxococcaceae bacterium]